jgi:hypothetical protein
MLNRMKYPLCLMAAALLALLAAPVAQAQPMHSVFLSVPGHSEEALTWCGPAVAQMVMDGYPGGACPQLQADIWAEIAAHRVEASWDTDPAGLRGAMMSLCPPPGGGWSVFHKTDAATLMYSVAFYMTHNGYAVPVLMSTAGHNSFAAHQEHWVAVKGIVTDLDPTTNPSVTLQYVWLTDPGVDLGDPPLERYVSAAVWYAELQTVTKAGSAYAGQFVAVIEPPVISGVAKAPHFEAPPRRITREEALQLAPRLVRELNLEQVGPFRRLRGARPMEAMLVESKRGPYYLVSYAVEGRPAGVAILIDAAGQFLEAGAFAPKKLLTEREALDRASGALRGVVARGQAPKAALTSGVEPLSRYQPVWTIATPTRTVLVDQNGRVQVEAAPHR